MYKYAYKKLEKEISGEIALNFVAEIAKHHRIQASPGIRAAVNYAVDTMKGFGVDAAVHDWPADGKTYSWTSLHIMEWSCKDAELKLVHPSSEYKNLARFNENKISIIQRSYPTPKKGVEGEVVILENGEKDADYKKVDVADKWVITNGNVNKVHEMAVEKRGALGLVYDGMFVRPPTLLEGELDDALKYTSYWWNGGEKPGFGFVLSRREGRNLRALVRKQEKAKDPVRLWGRVDSKLSKGTTEDAVFTIPGKTDEMVVVIAHICHPQPSANDNASGSGTAMEACRAISKLIKDGELPKPRRSIVFTLVPEMFGTYTYLASNEDKIPKMVAAVNLDMVGEDQDKCFSTLTVTKTPEALPSYVNALMEVIFDDVKQEAGNLGGSVRTPLFRHTVSPYSGGSDHHIYTDPNVGVACPMLIQWPDKFYHTSWDTVDKVSPDSLRRVAMMTATYAYSIANAAPEDSVWLVNEVASRSKRDMVNYVRGMVTDVIQNTAEAEDAGEKLTAVKVRLGKVVPYKLSRAREALLSVGRLAGGYTGFSDKVDRLCGDMERLMKAEVKEAQRTIDEHAAAIKIELPKPKRKRGTKLDKAAYAEFGKKYPLGRSLGGSAMFWTDGVRSVKEISDLLELEKGATNIDYLVGYYRWLEKMGLIRWA